MSRSVLLASTVACALVVVPLVTSCGPPVTGSGKLETRELDFRDFAKLKASQAFEVEVTKGNSFSVTVTLDDNLYEYLDFTRIGSTLYVRLKQGRTYLHTTQQAVITMPELLSLDLSGASRGTVGGFSSAENLNLDLSGASSLDIRDVSAGRTHVDASGASRVSGSLEIADGDFDLSGASTVELDGSARDVVIDGSGASTVRLAGFAVADADVDLSGGSDGTINASGTLDVDLSGASTLNYLGNPSLGRVEVSGGSRLTQE
jgi:hypothetical protein